VCWIEKEKSSKSKGVLDRKEKIIKTLASLSAAKRVYVAEH